MSNIDKRALREAAEKATKGQWAVEFDDEVYSTDGVNNEQIAMVFSENEVRDAAFIAAANPATVLALLDELEAKDRRIEEEIARANREHHRGFMMACGHLKEHSNVHYADAAEMEIAALRNRINELESAAAGKGEAS
ncbi:ead/Ea22-like family protein [Enterobacter hormaechei subsp. xiangfangensis]|uniref:ead/Ea22-like family protein n=2 Tax=Enterobacteriaceae TaxID=543 RepID=UPI000F848B1E|nr:MULTISPECIES: ead/Ea22-like family protein [Enterobacter]MBY0608551.1 ead/Ea22-like family protein [Enterobacter sp. TF2-1-2]MBY0624782.1 ead/Ea22-like family protein [Enterobacter sp. TF5]MCM7642540.1 ead/Ea22-like family protein [Enterobacter hormaechei]MCM8083913.1 ead/Ea22-like family protein [Enterobacter hormaechei]MCO7426959.1 ead/Ea22-like family protein [Enterobacter hormaechei]